MKDQDKAIRKALRDAADFDPFVPAPEPKHKERPSLRLKDEDDLDSKSSYRTARAIRKKGQ